MDGERITTRERQRRRGNCYSRVTAIHRERRQPVVTGKTQVVQECFGPRKAEVKKGIQPRASTPKGCSVQYDMKPEWPGYDMRFGYGRRYRSLRQSPAQSRNENASGRISVSCGISRRDSKTREGSRGVPLNTGARTSRSPRASSDSTRLNGSSALRFMRMEFTSGNSKA